MNPVYFGFVQKSIFTPARFSGKPIAVETAPRTFQDVDKTLLQIFFKTSSVVGRFGEDYKRIGWRRYTKTAQKDGLAVVATYKNSLMGKKTPLNVAILQDGQTVFEYRLELAGQKGELRVSPKKSDDAQQLLAKLADWLGKQG